MSAENETRVTKSDDANKSKSKEPHRAKRWWLIGGVGLLLLLVGGVAALPWIVAHTSLRNELLAWSMPDDRLQVESEGAELGWSEPAKLTGLTIRSRDKHLRISTRQIALEKSWLEAWRDSPHFGSLQIVEPEIDIYVEDLMKSDPEKKPTEMPTFTLNADVQNATVRLHSAQLSEPVLELDEVDARVTIDEVAQQSVLELSRTRILDDYPLRPELCREGLQLIAPIIADTTNVEGSVTLDFDQMRLPLNGNNQLTDIEGTLELHDVTTGLNNPVLQEAIGNLATMFGFDMPETIQLAKDAVIPFAVRNDRVHHENIQFLLPAVTGDRIWNTSGSVGFDESLDLVISAPVPLDHVFDSAVARVLSSKPIKLQVSGTIQEPELTLPEDASFSQQVSDVLLGNEEDEGDVDAFLDRVEAVIETGEAVAPIWDWTYEWLQGE